MVSTSVKKIYQFRSNCHFLTPTLIHPAITLCVVIHPLKFNPRNSENTRMYYLPTFIGRFQKTGNSVLLPSLVKSHPGISEQGEHGYKWVSVLQHNSYLLWCKWISFHHRPTLSIKKCTVIKLSSTQLVDNCTYSIVAFPCMKSSLFVPIKQADTCWAGYYKCLVCYPPNLHRTHMLCVE